MVRTFEEEVWKRVKFPFESTNDVHIEISSWGRVRSFSNLHKEGNIIKGTKIKGYPIIALKFFKPRDPKKEERLAYIKAQISKLAHKVGSLKTKSKTKRVQDDDYYKCLQDLEQGTKLLAALKESYRKEHRADELERTINYAPLVHRLVAENFVEQPTPAHFLVAHLDHNKLNNHYTNIKWMTREENVEHQKTSPRVIEAKKNQKGRRNESSKVYKLTSTKVMLIKKKINEGVPLRILAKSFKVTETQLLRIKRGINWGHIQAAS